MTIAGTKVKVQWHSEQQFRKFCSQPFEVGKPQVSRSFFDEQLRLTTNPLTADEGISYRTEQVYIPPKLVERKRQTREGKMCFLSRVQCCMKKLRLPNDLKTSSFSNRYCSRGKASKARVSALLSLANQERERQPYCSRLLNGRMNR